MFTTTTHNDGSTLTLELSGDLTLEHGSELHALLLEHREDADLRLDMRGAARMDLIFLQLLQALMRSRDQASLPLRFSPLPELLVGLGAALGAEGILKEISARTEEAA